MMDQQQMGGADIPPQQPIGDQGYTSYGGGMAGGAFDLMTFLRKPSTVLRALSMIFGLIVCWSVSSGGWYMIGDDDEICLFDYSSASCSWATVLGVFSLLAAALLLAIDATFEKITSVNMRRKVVLADLGTSGAFAALYVLTFLVLLKKWLGADLSKLNFDGNPPRAALAFTFFSMFTWGGCAYFAWMLYKAGADQAFAGVDPNLAAAPSGYVPGAGPDGSTYQQAPFSGQGGQPPPQQQQQTAYQGY